jgi:alkanesulfonate monooxygenase SsuD/methylene tetrahydromethanopterin reductase-like flavin-dependent oxidoreductase (luciferase family)
MSSGVRFDMFIDQVVPWPVMLEEALYFEKLGIGTLWIADHYALPYDPTSPLLEAWTTLAALAARTERIRLGTAVTNVSTRHPAMLAKQVATVDCISGGRIDLGLGPGFYEREHQWLGIPFLTPGGRIARFREAVDIVDRLLRDRSLSYQGEYYQLDDAPFVPAQVQQPRPPFTIAADGKKALRVVADYADIWLTLGKHGATLEESAQSVYERSQLLDEYCAEIGREPGTVERAYFSGIAVEFPFVSPDAFEEFVGRYREAGIERFVIWYASAGRSEKSVAAGRLPDRKVLETFAAEAMAAMTARPPHPSTV